MTAQPPANRTHFKTAEGRYLLSHEKVHPAGLIQYAHQRCPTKITLAHLDDRPLPPPPPSPSPPATSAGSRFAKNFLGAGSGTRGLPFGGGNGRQSAAAPATSGASAGAGAAGSSNGPVGGGGAGEREKAGGEGEGSYVIFNVGESLFVADANSTDKEPLKAIQFSATSGLHHAFDASLAARDAQGTAAKDARDSHDLLIGTNSGDIYTASLRAQLADGAKKLFGAAHYTRDGTGGSSSSGAGGGSKEGGGSGGSRCSAVAWVPGLDGVFVSAHADGNIYVYDKRREGGTEVVFPPIKDPHAFSTAHARSSKSNPFARWHISPSAINAIAFSPSGSHMATVSRDGYLRVFDWEKETLEGGCKSYYGAFLCCAFSNDGRLVAAGGEDDLVAVWDRCSHAVLGWCEGHASWVSAVAFDPFFASTPTAPTTNTATTTPPTTTAAGAAPTSPATPYAGAKSAVSPTVGATAGEAPSYRLGSVGQDTQLLLWDVALDDVVPPMRHLGSHPHHQSPAATSAPHPHDASSSHPPATSISPFHFPLHSSRSHSHTPGHASPSQPHGATSAPGTATSAPASGSGRSSAARSSSGGGSGAGGGGGGGSSSSSGGMGGSGGSGSSSGVLRDTAGGAAAAAALLAPPPSRKDVPRISPVMAHKVHMEPLSSLAFSPQAVLTACHEGCVKLWLRPGVTPPPGSIAAAAATATPAAATAPLGPLAAAATATGAVPTVSSSFLPLDPHLEESAPLSASDLVTAVERMR